MKIKDYNDAIEFFRTNDNRAADGAWSEFYQSEVLEPRIMDLAEGGRIGFKDGKDVHLDAIGRQNTKRIQKEKKYKEIIEDFIEKGDYENFKTQIYESQKQHKLPSGKWRQTKGGRVPTHIVKFIRDRLDAGPGTELFEDLIRITGKKLTKKEIKESIKKKKILEEIEKNPNDHAFRNAPDYDPYPEPDDFASGGVAKMLGE